MPQNEDENSLPLNTVPLPFPSKILHLDQMATPITLNLNHLLEKCPSRQRFRNKRKPNETAVNYIKEQSKTIGATINHFVNLRDAKTEIPVFCIHPSGGDVGIYRKLGRNLRSQTTIGIQSRMNFGAANEYDSIDQMAEVYASLIDQYQPTGPVRLLGFSFGGFIANAMVNQLKKLQREVEFFGVIDSDLRWVFDGAAVRENLAERLEQISLNLRNAGILNQMPTDKIKSDIRTIVDLVLDGLPADRFAQELESRGHTARSQMDTIKFQNFAVRFAAHCQMIQKFEPSAMEVPVHAWWPSEGDEEHESRSQCWRDLTLSDIHESTIEGSHYSIMKVPCVKQIATELSSVLTELQIRQNEDHESTTTQ